MHKYDLFVKFPGVFKLPEVVKFPSHDYEFDYDHSRPQRPRSFWNVTFRVFLHDELHIFGQVTDSRYKDTRSRSYEAKSFFFVLLLGNLSLFAMYESEEHYEGEVSFFFQLLKYHALSC